MPKSQESGSGFKRTVLLLLLCCLGAAVFQIRQAHKRLPELIRSAVSEQKLEKKGIFFEFEQASVTLVGSFSHPFGLRVRGLEFTYKQPCYDHNLKAQTLTLPVKILPLYKEGKLDLGLARLSDAKFIRTDLCGGLETDKTVEANQVYKKEPKRKSFRRTEKKIVELLSKLKESNTKFLNLDKTAFSLRGFLIYDLNVTLKNKVSVHVNRLKALLGAGDVKYKIDWDAKLKLDEVSSFVEGAVQGYEDHLDVNVEFKEKESLLMLELKSFVVKTKLDRVNLKLKSVPISFVNKFKRMDFAGLNLRKTWVDSSLNLDVGRERLRLSVDEFKIYGDFGLIETDMNSPVFEWSGRSWRQSQAAQLKLQKINFFEILGEKPRKKVSEVFKDFGHFNALIQLKSLDEFFGDFETQDFSILIRSQGQKAYQKIKSARGSLSFKKEKFLKFKLDDVGFESGDFEGQIELTYDYKKKNIHTDFQVDHLKFSPKVTTDLLGLIGEHDFSLKGEGFISKAKITKPGNEKYQSDLKFEMLSSKLVTEAWQAEEIESLCVLEGKGLDCKLKLGALSLNDNLQTKLGASSKRFTGLKSRQFEYEDKVLKAKLKSPKAQIDFVWNSKDGVVVQTIEPQKSDKVWTREL